jgi:amidohydrolase
VRDDPSGPGSGTVVVADLEQLYRDLHANPELSLQEHRTAALAAGQLALAGFEVTENVGGTGVLGVLANGTGPTALLRADMDALPVLEETGLPFASEQRAVDRDGQDVPVMHACGHDMHVTCLLGAARELAAGRGSWAGTLMLVFQPAEELGTGAQAMIDDGLFDRAGRPDIVLGQHVAPIPAGFVGVRPGPAFAAADSLRVTLYGRGAHGSRPETGIDPVVMAAATVMRLQAVVSREVAGEDTAIVTVGALRAGTKENIIPDDAELLLSIRTFDPAVRRRVLDTIERIVRAEAAASGATRDPVIAATGSFAAVVNDDAAARQTSAAFAERFGTGRVFDPGPVTGSEDVGMFATAAGAPCVYWLLGGADPRHFEGAATPADIAVRVRELPSNHSPLYAPVLQPTLATGIAALTAAVRTWLPPGPLR